MQVASAFRGHFLENRCVLHQSVALLDCCPNDEFD